MTPEADGWQLRCRRECVTMMLSSARRLGLSQEVAHDAVQLLDRLGADAADASPSPLAALLLLASRQGRHCLSCLGHGLHPCSRALWQMSSALLVVQPGRASSPRVFRQPRAACCTGFGSSSSQPVMDSSGSLACTRHDMLHTIAVAMA